MSKKLVLIIDDEISSRTLIREYLCSYPDLKIAGECQNGLEAVKYINMLEPDLIFLDIQMPGLNGFQVLQQTNYLPQVIFTTAYDQFAISAFEHDAVDYLLKPYTKERFDKAIFKVLRNLESTGVNNITENFINQYHLPLLRILVQKGHRMKSLDTNEIIYFKAEKDYTQIFTKDESYLSSFGIGAIEQKIDPQLFIRVNRSYIVNILHINELYKDIGKTFIQLTTGLEIAIGRKHLPSFKKMIF
ncbi:two component transcriptional regulator, LytTR family [bacterium A37T11]|nr:two component transcriptional regulator, LytTR family [bacterium A37T11]